MAAEGAEVLQLTDWEVLQSKIFTRWVNQKLTSRHFPPITDIRTDIGAGNNLANLMLALTEQEVPEDKQKKAKMPMVKAQVLEAIEKSLKMVWDAGVQLKLKPSSENLYTGDFKDVMSLVWGIMMKFMKFDDDEDGEQLSAKDALLKWLQFHLKEYPQVQVANLTKSFQDGMAFCCLIHKFRPKAIDIASLSPENKAANLRLAIDKAEELFGIEKYLTPSDIPKLDEKAMLVYCSEYYYHINEQAKRDLAAKRIAKLIRFTQENDAARAKYQDNGETLLKHIATAEALLQDVQTITNTMAGARQHLADFATYKSKEKKAIVALHLDMEANFNTLALRLANHNRPAFVPANAELLPSRLKQRIEALQGKEAVEPLLHAELNRQTKLLQLDKRHATQAGKLDQWLRDKTDYVRGDFTTASSGQARQLLTQFDSFEKEKTTMQTSSFVELQSIGQLLASEKFEGSSTVAEREAQLAARFAELTAAAKALRPVLEDSLQRELFREKTELDVKVHTDVFAAVGAFNSEKASYLQQKEPVASVEAAHLELSTLEACIQEIGDTEGGNVARLVALGSAIRAAKYATPYSTWTYPTPEKVESLETEAQAFIAQLRRAAEAKKEVLKDDLAREQFREKVELMVDQHRSQFAHLSTWSEDKLTYLETKEVVESSQNANYQLSRVELFDKEMKDMTEGSLASLRALGAEIRAASYTSPHSQWRYEKPESIAALEAQLADHWAQLEEARSRKRMVLEDDLARLLYAEHTRLMASQHQDKFAVCKSYADTKQTQLTEAMAVSSIADAQFLISQLESLDSERASLVASVVASLNALGSSILARKYESTLTSYVYEAPEAVKQLENDIDAMYTKLIGLVTQRRSALAELLAREQRKEELRLEFANLAADCLRFCNDKVGEVGTPDEQKTMYGFTLQEIEAYARTLEAEDAGIAAALTARKAAYTAVRQEMDTLNVTENAYTKVTLEDLESSAQRLHSALGNRKALYASELQRHRENDAKCQEFAAVVKPLGAQIGSRMAEAMDTSATEEAQLSTVTAALASAPSQAPDMASIARLEAEIIVRQVTINPYTSLSAEDVQGLWDNYMQVLKQRQPYLDNVVQYKLYRGIAPSQYEEMAAIFKTFDKDGSNTISEKEMRSCLFSLGEERTKKEVATYMQQYGTNGSLAFEPFRELMITLLGDAGTQEGLVESFLLLAQGQGFIEPAALAKVLEDVQHVAYLQSKAPPSAEAPTGLDYRAWLADVFSR